MPGRQLSGSWMVALVALLLLAAPAGAASSRAPDGPEPPVGSAFAFEVEGSNGYELLVLPRIGYGRPGQLLLIAQSRSAAVTYAVPATVTAEVATAAAIEADLGDLGRISVKLVPTGRQKSVRVGCEGKRRTRVDAARYEGTIEFHGEEGFTDISTTSAAVDYDTYRRMLCYELGFSSAISRPRGARLEIAKGQGDEAELVVSATKRHRGGKAWTYAGIRERRGEIGISREVAVFGAPGALQYAPDLRAATLRPPAPFAGRATFNRNARPANRWTGNLTVDFPGRSDVPLTGPGLDIDLTRTGR